MTIKDSKYLHFFGMDEPEVKTKDGKRMPLAKYMGEVYAGLRRDGTMSRHLYAMPRKKK